MKKKIVGDSGTMKMNKIPITFKVHNMQADGSEFMQRSVELEPMELYVTINLPPKKKYMAGALLDYWEAKTLAEVSGGDSPTYPEKIILTPKGIAKARQLINEAFKPIHTYAANHKDEWGEDDVLED